MSLVAKCDFCGEIYSYDPALKITTIVESRMYVDRKYSICSKCQYKLKEFMITLKEK